MDKASLLFCTCALAGSLLIAKFAFPYALISAEQSSASKDVVSADELGSLDLGEFGEVSVAEMALYYMENPPDPVTAEPGARKVRFEGC